MKSKKLFIELFIAAFFITACILIFVLIISYFLINHNHVTGIKERLLIKSEFINEIIKNDLQHDQIDKVKNHLKKINSSYNIKLKLFSEKLDVIYDIAPEYSNNITIEYIKSNMREGNISYIVKKNISSDKYYLILTFPVKVSSENLLLVAMFENFDNYKLSTILNFQNTLLCLILITICSLLMAFITSKKITSPLIEINKVIKSVLDGDFNQRVYADNFIEIESLSKNLNDMIYNLDKRITSLNDEKEEFKSIFASIKEAIIVINNDGLIIRSNKSFMDLFEIKLTNNKYYWEIIKESEIINYIKEEENKKTNILKEFMLKNKILLCSINYLEEKQCYVLIFYDVTALKNLENIKKDFISNASHELHTPLAAIKGFTETLMDGEKNAEKLKYLDIIRKNTERLIHIVKDLLVLSKLETANSLKNGININIEKINIDSFLKSLADMFEKNLKEKKIKFSYKILNSLKTIDGDFFKLEEMFINLIDNAIKYTDKGEIKIIISDIDEINSIKIEVIDTGIGIPEKDLIRIFERFYVVDKSRSKISGGTGLGLSIVKHVVMLHKGDIKVSSRLGEGSNFTIIMPKVIN